MVLSTLRVATKFPSVLRKSTVSPSLTLSEFALWAVILKPLSVKVVFS